MEFRKTTKRPINRHTRQYIRLVDKPACLVWILKSGGGAKDTIVKHHWHIKSVLRRAGVRA